MTKKGLLRSTLGEHLRTFHTAPFLFVGSGLSRRYLGIDDWARLLRRMSELTDRPYEYYRASGNGKEPEIATQIASALHTKWWDSDDFNATREQFKEEAITKESAFKIEVSKYIESQNLLPMSFPIREEIEVLKDITVDGIITTNWDLLLEEMFPDFSVYVGQERLLFSASQSIGEIYKIHGCCSEPNSLVVTSDDYASFRRRNPYLASKLLTLFVEHPVVFLGYSLSDQNISEILLSIAACLTTDNIDKLRDRLIIVDWNPEIEMHSISDTSIVSGGFSIPVKVVSVPNFVEVFQALSDLPRKFPARLLRKLKKHVYNLVHDNDPDDHLYVADIDDEADLGSLDVVFGVGVVKDSQDGRIRLSEDADAPAVRLTSDPHVPEIPFKAPVMRGAYDSVQEAYIGALRAWKTNPLAYIPKSELWDFYRSRLSLDLDDDGLKSLLVSSMHQNCPFHYWASRIGRESSHKIALEEVSKDQYPGIRAAVRLGFAIGMTLGEEVLQQIDETSKYSSARDQAKRLMDRISQGGTVWREYRSPAKALIENADRTLKFDVDKLKDDPKSVDEIITNLVEFGNKGRAVAKRLDALFYGSKIT